MPRVVNIHFHTLRHGFATTAALSGFSPRQLQAALDHEKFSTTERYLHDLQKMLVADQVGQAVRREMLKHLSTGSDSKPARVDLCNADKDSGVDEPDSEDDEPP